MTRPHPICLLIMFANAPFVRGQTPEASQPTEQARTARVQAEGYSRDDALRQALRKALEEGAGAQLAAFSTVENFALARDTIYSRASGIIREYRVLSERAVSGGVYQVEIEASVRPSAVAQTWGEVQNLLDQLGRPRILVWIDETIDGAPQDESIVESRIQEMLVKAGFDLVDRRTLEAQAQRRAAEAQQRGDLAEFARVAREQHAHVFIRGSANANRAGLEDLYGVSAAFYNCDVQARAYYADTGRLLASEAIPVTRQGVRSRREFSPQAARAALAAAALPPEGVPVPLRRSALASRLYDAVLEQWSIQLTAGGDIALEVENLTFQRFVELRDALRGLERVQGVEADFTSSHGRFRVRAQTSASTLAELLLKPPFAAWLEVTDLKPNRVQARAR